MPRYLIRLQFTSPLHIGKKGIGIEECSEFIHSDTLFSGLVNAWALIYGKDETDNLLKGFIENPENPPFLISSAFLYREKDGETMYFLPKPHLSLDSKTAEECGETLKDMDFVPHTFFAELAGAEVLSYRKDRLESAREVYQESFETHLVSRNELDRATLSSIIYWAGIVSFKEDAGLYFLLEINEQELAQFKNALLFLGERGLGGERNIGCGQFEIKKEIKIQEEKELSFLDKPSDSHDYHCSLSLTFPGEEDLSKIKDYGLYGLIKRSGFAYSPFFHEVHKKLPCWMLTEGSVFKEPISGQLVEVTPPFLKDKNGERDENDEKVENDNSIYHPIFRYGLSFMIGAYR